MINYDILFSLLTRSRDMITGSKRQKVKAPAEATQLSLEGERGQEVDEDNLL